MEMIVEVWSAAVMWSDELWNFVVNVYDFNL